MPSTKPSKGVIYVATGKKFVNEALESAKSCKQANPDLPICLFTDKPSDQPFFDQVRIIPDPHFSTADKVFGFLNSPYEQTLFLDTDTLVVNQLDQGFEALDKFDIAFASANMTRNVLPYMEDIPEFFPEIHTAVVYFNKSAKSDEVFKRWKEIQADQWRQEVKPPHDQPSFRRAMYESELRMMWLDRSFNFGFRFPALLPGKREVIVVHDRSSYRQEVAEWLNQGNRESSRGKVVIFREHILPDFIYFPGFRLSQRIGYKILRICIRILGR